MGFLDNLIRRETRRAIHSFVDSAVDNVVDKAKQNFNSNQNNNGNSGNGYAAANNTGTASDFMAETYCNGEPELRSRIEYIIRNEWQGYELVSNISAGTFGAKDGARDYSYGIYHNGAPVAMIMILHDNNEYRRKAVRLSHEACFCQSIPCMNFMSYMANYPSYISDRFRKAIRG